MRSGRYDKLFLGHDIRAEDLSSRIDTAILHLSSCPLHRGVETFSAVQFDHEICNPVKDLIFLIRINNLPSDSEKLPLLICANELKFCGCNPILIKQLNGPKALFFVNKIEFQAEDVTKSQLLRFLSIRVFRRWKTFAIRIPHSVLPFDFA